MARVAVCHSINAASTPKLNCRLLGVFTRKRHSGTKEPNLKSRRMAQNKATALAPYRLCGSSCVGGGGLEQWKPGVSGTTELRISIVLSVMIFASRCCLTSFGPWGERVNPRGLYLVKTCDAKSPLFTRLLGWSVRETSLTTLIEVLGPLDFIPRRVRLQMHLYVFWKIVSL